LAGLGDEATAAIRVGGGSGLSPARSAALAYANAMTVHVSVPDEVFGADPFAAS
jgi:hypothetical protein